MMRDFGTNPALIATLQIRSENKFRIDHGEHRPYFSRYAANRSVHLKRVGCYSELRMIDRRTAVLSTVVIVAIAISVLLTFVLHSVFNLGTNSLVSFPFTLIGTMLAVRQYLEEPKEGTTVQVFQHKNVTTQTMPEKSDGGWNWSEMTDHEIAEVMQSSPDWRSYEDNAFENYRSLGKGFNWLSSIVLNSQYVTRKRIMLLLFAISTTGGMWLFLIFAEVMGTSWPEPNYMTTIAQLSPLSIDMGGAIISIFPAVALLFAPLAYLQFKSNYTCPDCRQPFGLASEGRYYRPNMDVQATNNGREVNGHRILRCENCNKLAQEETDWSLRD